MIWTLLANRYVRYGLAALSLVLLLWGVVSCIRHDAAKDERARAAEQETKRGEAATNRAEAEKNAQDARAAANQANMQGAIDNAVQSNPEQVRRPVGPATDAVLQQLRSRSAAKQR